MALSINTIIEILIERTFNFTWYNDKYISKSNSVIIGGCARSGTTLFRVMIDSHRNLYCGPETGILYRNIISLKKLRNLSKQLDIPLNELQKMKKESISNIQFIETVFTLLQKNADKKRWGEKSPMNVLYIERIFKYFPKAQFIHIIRDGRDTSCSLRHFPKRKLVDGELIELNTNNPLDECIKRWVHDVQEGLKWRGDPRYLEVKYEDLITNPEATMSGVFRFLNEPWDENVLKYYQVRAPNRSQEKIPQNIRAREPIDKSSLDRWKNEFTEKDKALFKEIAGNLLIKLGYERDNDW